MGHKGYYGQYSGNAKWSRNHADTKVTKENYKASERDDAAHIDYLKRDVDYDNKHGHSDESMTADEKHISKLAGDMKYDKEHHGSAAKMVSPLNADEKRGGHARRFQKGSSQLGGTRQLPSPDEAWAEHQKQAHHQSAPAKMVSPLNDSKSTNKKHNTYNPAALKNHIKSKHANDEKEDIKPSAGKNQVQPQLTGMKKNN